MAKETPEVSRDVDGADDISIRCARCDHPLTERTYRIAMMGAHAHTFVNPAGFAYEIGCFAEAPGCAADGALDATFSWFPGWAWQLAICGRCHAHVGWRYQLADQAFHGLILNRLKP